MYKINSNDIFFEFPEIHDKARLSISFQRTLRIPDDGKQYPLPPGLGTFPLKKISEFKDRVPCEWLKGDGLMLPMYQSEALWMRFTTYGYPCAIRVATGNINAVTGKPFKKKLRKRDHMVVPPQPWLDGFCVGKGKIKQFVAMPLGWGTSVEQQITGKEEVGGLQIEVWPMKKDEYEKIYTNRDGECSKIGNFCNTGQFLPGLYSEVCTFSALAQNTTADACCRSVHISEMALGAGGEMKQEIYKDTNDLSVWEKKCDKVFIHLANSFTWQAITQQDPPTAPLTAAGYASRGYPWFDHYLDNMPILDGGENLKQIKSILELGFQKGIQNIHPENESFDIPNKKIIKYGDNRDQLSLEERE